MNREGQLQGFRPRLKDKTNQNKQIKKTNEKKKQQIFVLHKGRGKEYALLVLRPLIWLFLVRVVQYTRTDTTRIMAYSF